MTMTKEHNMTYPLNLQRLCLYDVEWQALRVQLLGKWSKDCDVVDALQQLHNYVWRGLHSLPKSKTSTIMRTRLYRVINLLNAVRMSWGANPVSDFANKQLVADRDEYQKLYGNIGCTARADTWETVTGEQILDDLKYISPELAKAIYTDLHKRYRFAVYKTRATNMAESEAIVAANRPELVWALRYYERH